MCDFKTIKNTIRTLLFGQKIIKNILLNQSYETLSRIWNLIIILKLTKNLRIDNVEYLIKLLKIVKYTINDSESLETHLENKMKEFIHLSSTQEHTHDAINRSNKVGIYYPNERKKKILKFKLKRYIWRMKKPVIKKYEGRSVVAKNKPRLRGKFIKNNSLRRMFSVIKD